MKESNESRHRQEVLFNERHQSLLNANMLPLIISNSGIESGKHTLEIDMEFKGDPKAIWDICRSKMQGNTLRESSRMNVEFDGSILVIRSQLIHYEGPLLLHEVDKNIILGRAIRNSLEVWGLF